MKRRTFNIAMHGGQFVPCTGWEFDAGGIALVAHRELLEAPDRFGPLWEVHEPATGYALAGVRYAFTRADAISNAKRYVARNGADTLRKRIEDALRAGKAGA